MSRNSLIEHHNRALSVSIKCIDLVLFLFAGWLMYVFRIHQFEFNQDYFISFIFAGVLILPVFSKFGLYHSLRGQTLFVIIRRLLLAIISLMALLMAVAFITKVGSEYSRLWFFSWMVLATFLLIVFRVIIMSYLRMTRKKGINQRRVIIIGAGGLGARLTEIVSNAPWSGFAILGVLDEVLPEKQFDNNIVVEKIPEDLAAYVSNKQAHEVWITLPLRAEDQVRKLLQSLQHNIITVRYFPNLFGMGLLNQSVNDFLGFPVLNIKTSPMVGLNRLVKAIEDRLLALIFLIILSPIMLVIALLVKLTSKGPILYKQKRLGWDGKPFKVYKFRSMIVHQEAEGQVTQAARDDVRFTKVGKLLRKTSLDELPQFFNVLQGRMSIVGPRPHVLVQNEHFKDIVPSYMQRHQVKPGITGWAQVNGWRGETDSLEKLEKRTEYDLYYINNWSLWFDLKIILLTIFKGLLNKNAY